MKKASVLKLAMFAAVSILLIGTSCKKKEKEKEKEPVPVVQDTEEATVNDNNTAEGIAADIEFMGSEVTESGSLSTARSSASGSGLSLSNCATVTVVQKVVTVDFGTGCVCSDGKTRSGKLIYDFTASTNNALYYRHPGFRMDVTAQNYVVDSHSVTINQKIVQNTTPVTIPTGTNPGTNLTWSVTANIGIAKPTSTQSITWTCARTKELLNTNDPNCYKGRSTPIDWSKAKVKIDGAAGGTNARSESYTVSATGLIRDFQCTPQPILRPNNHPFIGGTLVYTPGSRPARTIAYGDGVACDFSATITINNTSHVYNF